MHGGHSERRNGHFVLWLLVKMTKFPGLYERKVKGGVKINEHYGAKTKDKQSKRIDIKGLYRNKSSIPSSAPFYMFFPLGLILLPPTSLPPPPSAGSQCDIWRSDVAALGEEACDYAQLI